MTYESTSPTLKVLQIPGTPYYCLGDDGAISRLCCHYRRLDWDQSYLEIPEIASRLVKGAVVVDVGAFIGDTAHLFIKRGCNVIAIEPQQDAFTLLEFNCPEAICIRKPVGARGQRVVLTDTVSNTVANNLGARQVAASEAGTPVLALDDLNPHRCDFLKIDVEGFEPHALAGGEQFIRRTRPVLQIEINLPALRSQGFADHRSVYAPLENWGYRISVPQMAERIGTDLPWDIVCVPE
jgi:FkbM family methyltransferase